MCIKGDDCLLNLHNDPQKRRILKPSIARAYLNRTFKHVLPKKDAHVAKYTADTNLIRDNSIHMLQHDTDINWDTKLTETQT